MENNYPTNGWSEYKKLVLKQLEMLDAKTDRIETKLDKINTKVTILETKAWMWGAMAGLAITFVIQVLLTIFKLK